MIWQRQWMENWIFLLNVDIQLQSEADQSGILLFCRRFLFADDIDYLLIRIYWNLVRVSINIQDVNVALILQKHTFQLWNWAETYELECNLHFKTYGFTLFSSLFCYLLVFLLCCLKKNNFYRWTNCCSQIIKQQISHRNISWKQLQFFRLSIICWFI